MKQPREDVKPGTERFEPWLDLSSGFATKVLLAGLARHLQTATLVGNPAPVVKAMYQRITSPIEGDVVVETSILSRYRHRGDVDALTHGVGILLEKRREWWDTDEEYAKQMVEDPYGVGDERPIDTAWYVQYGQSPEDVCRWVNCSFLVVPPYDEEWRPPIGPWVDRDAVVASLADSGFALRLPET